MVLITEITAPEDGLIYTSTNIQLKIGEKIVGSGKLYISQGALAWQADNMSEGISILWKQVSVHGISSNPSKCIYFMLDHKLVWRGVYDPTVPAAANGGHNGAGGDGAGAAVAAMAGQNEGVENDEDEGNVSDDDNDEEPEEEQITECWLIPDDINTVDVMFQAMTDCQALHPDSADSISEESDFMDDDGDDDDNDALGPAANNGNDAAAAQGGMQNLNLNDDRFADADE